MDELRRETGNGRTVGAHELGSYAYCPRAWWYDHHPEERPGRNQTGGRDVYEEGLAFHQRLLSAHLRAEENSPAPYAVAALTALLILGGILWWFRWFPF